MDTPTLSVPRLRFARYSQSYLDNNSLTPVAGPSRLSPDANPNDYESASEDEDTEATPRLSNSAILPDRHSPKGPSQSNLPAETPAARLRALLARVPNTSSASNAPSARPPVPPSPSEYDSDLDAPPPGLSTRSIARESLKDLFSHALRDPGDTPRRQRPRRNSDVSEVESSPRVEWVQEERARNKGKRRSMSDEEAEKASKPLQQQETSYRSPAAVLDALRHRLARSSTLPPTPPPEDQVMDMSMPPADSSGDTATLLKQANKDEPSQPNTSSAPMQSLRMSTNSQVQMQSNLLEQDSEMHRALNGMDSFEGPSTTNQTQRPLSFPPPRARTNGHSVATPRPLSWNSHSKSHSHHNIPLVKRVSDEFDSTSSRASSSLSGADYKDRHDDVRQRERKWNQPQPRSPGHSVVVERSRRVSLGSSYSNDRTSPAPALSRRSSIASMASTDDGRSSRASSIASRSEYGDKPNEPHHGLLKERERAWNSPRPRLSHSSSSLNLRTPERVRALSQPDRPNSPSVSPSGQTVQRHVSLGSISSSSRAGSPTSVHSTQSVEESKEEPKEVRVRERNWNSPQPKWKQSDRTSSPLPLSPSSKVNSVRIRKDSKLARPLSYFDQRVNGNGSSNTQTFPGGSSGNSPQGQSPRSKSPTTRRNGESKSQAQSTSPPRQNGRSDDSAGTGFGSRFGWSFPHNKTELPPLELESNTPERPQPPSRTSETDRPSYIPVRSPKKNSSGSSSAPPTPDKTESRRRNRRDSPELGESTDEFSADDLVSMNIPMPSLQGEEPLFGSDTDSPPATSTPTAKLPTLPSGPDSPSHSPTTRKSANGDAQRLEKALERLPSPPSSPSSPPETESQFFSLQTPPRRPQFSNSQLDFQTPSPPKNMPDLPDLPVLSDTDIESSDPGHASPTSYQGNLTAMKTPKPPGAWAATPVPPRRHPDIPRPSSTPPDGTRSMLAENTFASTPAGLSRAGSLPIRTPAPPGAWMATPEGSVRRKSILKVRFDLESEAEVVSSDAPPAGLEPPKAADAKLPATSEQNNQGQEQREARPPQEPLPREERPSTPQPSLSPRKPRRSPGVRVVDAFGRDAPQDEPADDPEPSPEVQPPPPPPPVRESRPPPRTPSTPRNQSSVKIVDAMGREVEEPSELSTSEFEMPMSHNEALARVRQTINHLAEDLSEVDKSHDELALDHNRIHALEDASKAARSARTRIARSLQLVKSAEVDLRTRYGPLRESMRKSKFLPTITDESPASWKFLNAWFLWAFVVIQLLLFLVMLRLSYVRARRAFLTTYYDPFYSDLYLYVVKPDTTQCAIPSSPWSFFIADNSHDSGHSNAITKLRDFMICSVASWQRQIWEIWNTDYPPQGTVAWPPT